MHISYLALLKSITIKIAGVCLTLSHFCSHFNTEISHVIILGAVTAQRFGILIFIYISFI